MSTARAPAKINLALVVGPLRDDGKHEVATVLQHIELADRIAVARGERLSVSGFDGDTIVASALTALAAAAHVDPSFVVEISKAIPVAAGLGGGSSDAATALLHANALLPAPLDRDQLDEVARAIGADVPFFLRSGPHLGSGDGSTLAPLAIPQDFWIVLLLADGATKSSTGDVYAAFDARNGADGFAERTGGAARRTLESVREPEDLRHLPANDLTACRHAEQLVGCGAFRADVSGAGPCVYGLFSSRSDAASRLRMRCDPRAARGSPLPPAGERPCPRGTCDVHGPRFSPSPRSLRHGRPGGRVHSASRFTGAWPSGKATGFGPVIPGSNPGAPANVPTVSESRPKLAAVVMAGGRGTRMRSAIPKHLHPLLGRRMVDWIIEAALPLSPESLVVVASPETADQFDGRTVAVQHDALGTGDAVRCARTALPASGRGAHPLR